MKTVAILSFLVAGSAFAYDAKVKDMKKETAEAPKANICFVCEDTTKSVDGLCKNKKNLNVDTKAECTAANGIWGTAPISKKADK